MSVTGFMVDGQIQKYDYGSLDNLPDIPESSGTFWATYNSTSEAEITDAFSNNKSVMMKIGNDVFYVTRKLSIGPSGSAWLFVSVGNTNIRTTWVSGSYWNSFSTNTIGGEISNDLKQALLQLASKVAYIDEDGQTYYDDLYDALYPHELMSISATFNQGSNIIYDIDPLTVLNQYLTVVANYSNGTTETISSSNYTLSGNLSEGVSTITVYYEGFTDTFNVNVTHMAGYYTIVNNLTGCTTNNSATAIQENTSYTAIITASAGYTLSGATVTITMGGNILTGVFSNGTISIPNVTGNLVITVVASAVTLSSISAVYTQSGTVYDTDTLDSLKGDLIVTAHYSDSSTQTVPAGDYTLSGTLTAGTSTITVSYGGKTTTFDVTVTAVLYSLFDHTFEGADPINTELYLLQNDRDFTMVFDVDFAGHQVLGPTGGSWKLFNLINGTSPWAGLCLQRMSASYNRGQLQIMTWKKTDLTEITDSFSGNLKLVIRHSIGNSWEYWLKIANGSVLHETVTETFNAITNPLGVGGSHTGNAVFCGTFNSCIVYPSAVSDDRISAFMGA